MVIADAQVHLWAAERPDRPWIPGGKDYVHLPEPLEKAHLVAEMDRVGVDRAFLVSPTWEGARNDVVLDAAETYPDRFGVIARFDPEDGGAKDALSRLFENDHVLGMRAVFYRGSREWLRDGTAEWVWPLAEELNVPVMIFAPGQCDEIGRVAEQYPKVRIAVCHLGIDPVLRDDQILPHIDNMLELSRFSNVAVKASSLPSYVTDPYPFTSLHGHIKRTVDAFGSQRVFWGSDLSRLRCRYDEWYRVFTEELTFLSDEDRANVMGDAICRWFGWAF